MIGSQQPTLFFVNFLFDEKFISSGKRCKLLWKLNPIPTNHSNTVLKRPSTLPTPTPKRKPPPSRTYQNDELKCLKKNDLINSFEEPNEKHAPQNFLCKKSENSIIYFNLIFDDTTNFPKTLDAIKIDQNLHVKRKYNGLPVPLPSWFVQGGDAKLKRISILQNIPSYIRNMVVEKKTQY